MSDTRGFLGVTRLVVSRDCLDTTYRFLRRAGRKGYEGVVLWPGRRDGPSVRIDDAYVPRQTVFRSEHGLGYRIEEEDLARLADHLADHGLVLPVQVHSHPGEAYHSEADDADPIVATLGGVSIVVPDFASGLVSPSAWAVYRLFPSEGWVELTAGEVDDLIVIGPA
ncbi:MAG: hypothetical protein CMM84_18855 [Rhodothermaceae bacterium]|nr:hypothetical protein [Rhodothermaceae bacterium]MBC13314.1 hypothetical protein [Rhodothermaceae bacterium]MBC13364.1 hypothetical protein [Rhodothermaceae bacterium]MBC15038.1 hypothetical protein [Rhodothermaceae bacterium]MBC15379.1 hypothetical protein [Rhodothermaceae bacterium]|tara:strand:- start:145 stop:645 length:501 start_codon:yes stop_codon:yes gene_type:complete